MRAILLCKPSYILVCAALPLSSLCSTKAAASFFLLSGSMDSSRALLGVAASVRAAEDGTVSVIRLWADTDSFQADGIPIGMSCKY